MIKKYHPSYQIGGGGGGGATFIFKVINKSKTGFLKPVKTGFNHISKEDILLRTKLAPNLLQKYSSFLFYVNILNIN